MLSELLHFATVAVEKDRYAQVFHVRRARGLLLHNLNWLIIRKVSTVGSPVVSMVHALLELLSLV